MIVNQTQDPPEDIAELRDMIRPEDVIAAVKAYIEDMSVEAGPVGVSTAAVSGNTKSSQEEVRHFLFSYCGAYFDLCALLCLFCSRLLGCVLVCI